MTSSALGRSGAVTPSLLPSGAQVDANGVLSIHGRELRSLAEEFGTPLFIYDEDHIRTQIREAKSTFNGTIAYASKAFLCRAMSEIVAQEEIHLDAASMGEIFVALSGGVLAENIVFHGNNKSSEELAYALQVGVGRIVVDSFDEIERIEALTERRVSIWLRVTPGIEAHTHDFIKTGQDDSKFGFNVANGDASRAIKRARRSRSLNLLGVHAHIGSQIFRVDSFIEEFRVLAELMEGEQFSEVNLGGGLGVPYLKDEVAPSLRQWLGTLNQSITELGIKPDVQVYAEPGRSIVATAGLTLYRIGTRKEIPGVRRYVSIDGGMSDNPRPVLYDSGYEAFLPERLNDPHDTPWSVAGKHCESGDVIVRDAALPADLDVDELLVTPVTGAYGYAMSSNYNKIPRPAVVFVAQSGTRVAVRRETLEDLLSKDMQS